MPSTDQPAHVLIDNLFAPRTLDAIPPSAVHAACRAMWPGTAASGALDEDHHHLAIVALTAAAPHMRPRTALASSRRALTAPVHVATTPQEGDRVVCVELAIPGLPPVLITQDDADRLASAIYDASTDAREANDPGSRRA